MGRARGGVAVRAQRFAAGRGCGGMRASRPTDARLVTGIPFGRSRKFIRRGGIYCARRRVSEANRRAAAALRPEIPPVEPCAAVGSPGRYGIGPTGGKDNAHSRPRAFAMPQACGTMRASSPTVSTAFSFAAGQGGPIWNRPLRSQRVFGGRFRVCRGALYPGGQGGFQPGRAARQVFGGQGLGRGRGGARFSRATASISLMRFSWLTRVALGS